MYILTTSTTVFYDTPCFRLPGTVKTLQKAPIKAMEVFDNHQEIRFFGMQPLEVVLGADCGGGGGGTGSGGAAAGGAGGGGASEGGGKALSPSKQGDWNCLCDTPTAEAKSDFGAQCGKCLRWIHGECSGFEAEEDLPEYFVCKHPQCTASGGSDGSHGDADIIDQSMTAAGINVCGSTPSLGLVEAEKWVACVMTLMTSPTSIFYPRGH